MPECRVPGIDCDSYGGGVGGVAGCGIEIAGDVYRFPVFVQWHNGFHHFLSQTAGGGASGQYVFDEWRGKHHFRGFIDFRAPVFHDDTDVPSGRDSGVGGYRPVGCFIDGAADGERVSGKLYFPVLILLAGLVVIFRPWGSAAYVVIILGYTAIFYGITDLISHYQINKLRKRHDAEQKSHSRADIEDADYEEVD